MANPYLFTYSLIRVRSTFASSISAIAGYSQHISISLARQTPVWRRSIPTCHNKKQQFAGHSRAEALLE